MARLKDIYKSRIISELTEKFGYDNPMAVPKIEKIVVSMGLGKATQDKKFLGLAKSDLVMITGQMPSVCKARVSVSSSRRPQGGGSVDSSGGACCAMSTGSIPGSLE